MAGGELVPASSADLAAGARIPEWVPCQGCLFAGNVVEISVEGTALASDPLTSEGNIVVTYQEHDGAIKSGEVVIGLSGDSYGTGDDYDAACIATGALKECSSEDGSGPVNGYRAKFAGIGLFPTRACGAFSQVNENGVVVRKPGVLRVTNAK